MGKAFPDRLPAASWMQREGMDALVAALGADQMRWVGGAVRDTLLDLPVSDVDVATLHHPQTVINLCTAAGIRTIPTGIEHGTVTAILPGGPVEVTTLRRDVATDGRRATIAFATDWRDDAARRDFTINALYAHPETLTIDDYFGGLSDLAARHVRFIGDAATRIREDHLRILRYVRFRARFGDMKRTDGEAENACHALAHTVEDLSRERIGWELTRIMALPDPTGATDMLMRLDVLHRVVPGLANEATKHLAALVDAEQANDVHPDPVRRLAALIPATSTAAAKLAKALRLSSAQSQALRCLAGRDVDDTAQPRRLAFEHGLECAIGRLLLAGSDLADLLGWAPPAFPLSGSDVLARGVRPGPEVGRVMRTVQDRWIEEDFPPRTRVLTLLEREINKSD
ncbi:Polynucleotide adenylyltransferase [Alteripontixanthobacter maritimus]|uniref:Polynucleotide adenylyltransferase n=1 Tax=Alteripontixanthobacter maritimus TaxID=2161824 RepID=A0A369QE45_9SPHN|nr:CCA tRNA nucleotidyltransferase [Alteripontixanthobacter maritimus]RDC60548.1 Polynucleotide adenylyltransferase [Alteripontixanthobacter maritimus]